MTDDPRKPCDPDDVTALRRDLDALDKRTCELDLAIVDLRGEDGNGGKYGALREKVDEMRARRWWLVTWAAGLLVAVVTSAVVFGRWMGHVETDLETLKARAFRRGPDLSLPADAPAKDSQ